LVFCAGINADRDALDDCPDRGVDRGDVVGHVERQPVTPRSPQEEEATAMLGENRGSHAVNVVSVLAGRDVIRLV